MASAMKTGIVRLAAKGVQAVTSMYYLSSSGYELSGGSWSSTPPTSIGDMFLWTKTITRYTDGTTSETEPYCLTSRTAVNLLENGSEEKSSTTRLMGEYMPFNPLVAGKQYKLTVCATLASDVFRLDLLMSRGNTNKCTLYPIVSTEPQILSKVFTAGYYGELTPEADIQWAYCNIYRNVYTDLDSVTYPQSTIHWVRIDVGLLREQKMYALGTSQTTAPTSGWQTTVPASVTGYFLWEKTVQYYDNGTQGDMGVACIQGATGFTGPRSRIRYWEEVPTGGYFYSGVAGNEFYDIVVYADEYYKCIIGHSKGSTTPPNDTYHWERAQEEAYVAADLLHADKFIARQIETIPESESTQARVLIRGSEMFVFGKTNMNIRFGVDADGFAVMQYFDNSGNLLYDLGPKGISMLAVVEQKWEQISIYTTSSWVGANTQFTQQYNLYKFTAQRVAGIISTSTEGVQDAGKTHADYDGLYFTAQSLDMSLLAGKTGSGGAAIVGVLSSLKYTLSFPPPYDNRVLATTDSYLVPYHGHYGTLRSTPPIKYMEVYRVMNGLLSKLGNYYWNG